jgi:hypothetical protein
MDNVDIILNDNNFRDFKVVRDGAAVAGIPQTWKDIINAESPGDKRSILNRLWQPFAGRLDLTIAIFDRLTEAVVIVETGEYKLVYIFEIEDMLSAYVGHLPVQSGPFLEHLPEDIAEFYRTVHNGWYENISGGLGLLALDNIQCLGDYEWGIMDDIAGEDLDLSKIFMVFHNGGAGYLCFNMADKSDIECLIFWTTKAPRRHIDFWPVIDSWIEIGLSY